MADRFADFKALLSSFIHDPANGYVPKGREIDSLDMTYTTDCWVVLVTLKAVDGVKSGLVSRLKAVWSDSTTHNIVAEEVFGWMWRKTQLQIKALHEKGIDE
jgi:hypothetical protein